MSKKALRVVLVSVLIFILAGIILFFFFSEPADINNHGKTKSQNTAPTNAKPKEIPDYEGAYLEYIKENYSYFSSGMILCDLNDDCIPELFSLTYDDAGSVVYYHEFKDGKVIAPSADSVKTYIDFYQLIRTRTYFESPTHFLGIYENTTTGQKALINSLDDGIENDRFDIIAFNGDTLSLTDKSVKTSTDSSQTIAQAREKAMLDYTLSKDRLYAKYRLQGQYGGEYGSDPQVALGELIDEFKAGKSDVNYSPFKKKEFYCYIRNINPQENEIELIPVATINLKQYYESVNSDRLFVLNGESLGIQADDFLSEKFHRASLYQMPFFEYSFDVPTKRSPVSIINGYMGNDPVKVKLSKNLKVRYGVLGRYDNKGNPVGYESLGREKEYTLSQYLPNFASYYMGNYYKATIKNNKLVFLDVLYHQ